MFDEHGWWASPYSHVNDGEDWGDTLCIPSHFHHTLITLIFIWRYLLQYIVTVRPVKERKGNYFFPLIRIAFSESEFI